MLKIHMLKCVTYVDLGVILYYCFVTVFVGYDTIVAATYIFLANLNVKVPLEPNGACTTVLLYTFCMLIVAFMYVPYYAYYFCGCNTKNSTSSWPTSTSRYCKPVV
jgi:hypothetical protein